MFTGGISPFAFTSLPGAGLSQNGGLNSQSLLGVKPNANKPGAENSSWNTFFGGDSSNPDLLGVMKTMLGPLFQQYGISLPGVTPESTNGNGEGNNTTENADTDEEATDKKWKATLQAAMRVQDNVEAVKVAPPDDSGYYSSMSIYSGS